MSVRSLSGVRCSRCTSRIDLTPGGVFQPRRRLQNSPCTSNKVVHLADAWYVVRLPLQILSRHSCASCAIRDSRSRTAKPTTRPARRSPARRRDCALQAHHLRGAQYTDKFHHQGATFWNTATIYGPQSHNEKLIGEVLREGNNREKVVLGTKWGIKMVNGEMVLDGASFPLPARRTLPHREEFVQRTLGSR